MSRLLGLMLSVVAVVACREPIHPFDQATPQSLHRHEGPPAEYQEIDLLATLIPGGPGFAVDINNAGLVVGQIRQPDGQCPCQAFLWRDGTVQLLGTLGGASSYPAGVGGFPAGPSNALQFGLARALNEGGQIVGSSYTAGGQLHAFLWKNGQMGDLGTLHGGTSEALQINDKGQVIGTSDGEWFLWEGGSMEALPLTAAAINDKGEIAGWVTAASGKRRAVLWHRGKITELGTLGGDESWARALNNSGVVVGASRTATGELRAFRWKNGHMTDLGLPPGWVAAEAKFVNKRGDISGEGIFEGDPDDTRGFFWSNGSIVDIGVFRSRTLVNAMNKHGVIVGWTRTPAGPLSDRNPIVWQDGVLHALVTPYRLHGNALAVNDRGAVVGYNAGGNVTLDTRHAVLWLPVSPTVVTDVAGVQ